MQAAILCVLDSGRGSELVSLLLAFQPYSLFPAQHSQRSCYSVDTLTPSHLCCEREPLGDLEGPSLTPYLSNPFLVLMAGLFSPQGLVLAVSPV